MNRCFYAKYTLISILFAFLAYTSCTTATPQLFQNDIYLRSSEKYYKITLLAYGPGTLIEGKKSKAGHASLSIERSGVWGFYPSTPGKLMTTHGVLKYSTEYPRTQEYADFFIDEGIMNKIFELIAEWENNPPTFIIPFNDCVSFIYRICDIIGLRYNNLKMFPASAICEIRNLNDQNHIYTSK